MEYVTAGESHGPKLTAIVSGVPAGVPINKEAIDADLARRQGGYGRGGRQKIEHDTVRISSGLRFGKTMGSPVCLEIANKDYAAWESRMAAFGDKPDDLVRELCPRPGHADLAGILKTASDDCRDVLERASARETAARVVAGAVAKALLACFGVTVVSYVTRIGSVSLDTSYDKDAVQAADTGCIEASPVRCPDAAASQKMCEAIDDARAAGQSLGGCFTVEAHGLVAGIGSYADPKRRLSARLAGAVFSIPAIKGLEFGGGFSLASAFGGDVHDEIVFDEEGYGRSSNNAGGLEGGMTSGEPLLVHAAMKPIPTLMTPLRTVSIDTHEPVLASKERSDVCAVPACAVVAEAEVAFVLAQAYLEKFGQDCMDDILGAYEAYRARIAR